MAENKRLNDEELKNAVGGSGLHSKPMFAEEATIIGSVLEDPGRTNTSFAGEWKYIMENGGSVYAVSCKEYSDAAYATAYNYYQPNNKVIYQAGDRVYINAIRGDYGYEIEGLVSDFE